MTWEIQPTPKPVNGPRVCSIADALEILGDRWSLLIVRECSYGVHRFTDIHRNTGAASDILTSRLKRLEEVCILHRKRYSWRPERYGYFLTETGEELFPILLALREWGERQLHPGDGSGESCLAQLRSRTPCRDGVPSVPQCSHASGPSLPLARRHPGSTRLASPRRPEAGLPVFNAGRRLLPPTRFLSLRLCVQPCPPPSATCTSVGPVRTGRR